jgi:hypothetical protein
MSQAQLHGAGEKVCLSISWRPGAMDFAVLRKRLTYAESKLALRELFSNKHEGLQRPPKREGAGGSGSLAGAAKKVPGTVGGDRLMSDAQQRKDLLELIEFAWRCDKAGLRPN